VAVVFVQPRQFPAEKGILRKFLLQSLENFASLGRIFLAQVGDGQKNARKWGEQLALSSGRLEFGDFGAGE